MSSVEVWKFWSKLWIFVWPQCLAMKIMPGIKGWIKVCCVCTLEVSIFGGNSKLPCKSFHLIQRTFLSQWIWPQSCYSLVTDIPLSRTITLSHSHSHTLLVSQMQWEKILWRQKQKRVKARTSKDQTQEYNTINITRIQRLFTDQQLLTDRQHTGWHVKRTGGQGYSDFPVYMWRDLCWAAFGGWAEGLFINGWLVERRRTRVRSLEERRQTRRGDLN